MIRIQTYNSTPRRIQAGGINPGNQPTLRTVSGREEDRTLAAMLQSGLKLTDIIVKEYVQNETTRVEQSLADMNAELAAERERYMRENQGQNALNAGEHFEQFARNLRDKTLADGKFQGRFADIFMKQASGLGFNFTEQGRSYARQQRGAWYDSVKKSMVSEIMNLAAQDYDDPDKIAYQLENYKSYLDTIQHGMDNRGELNKVFQNVAETRVDGYLAHNRIADARDAFEESREMLGDRANAVKVRIDAHADALQAKAEAQRKKALDREIQTMSNALVRAVQLLPQEDVAGREHLLVEMAAQIQDPELRDKALAGANREISFNRRLFEARQDAVTAEFNTPQVRSMSPAEKTARLNQYLDEGRITQQTYDVLNRSINGGPTFTVPSAFNTFMDMATGTRDDGTPWFRTETELRAAMTEAGTLTLADQDKIVRAQKDTQKAESTTATAKEKTEAEAYRESRNAFLQNLEALGVDEEKTYQARVYFNQRFEEFREQNKRWPTEQEMLSMSAAAIQKIWTGQKRGLGGKVEMSLYEASVQIPAEVRRQIRAELLRAGHKPEDITEEMVIQEYHRNDNQAMREVSIFNTDSWGYYVE